VTPRTQGLEVFLAVVLAVAINVVETEPLVVLTELALIFEVPPSGSSMAR
jgi:hypothetical protein